MRRCSDQFPTLATSLKHNFRHESRSVTQTLTIRVGTVDGSPMLAKVQAHCCRACLTDLALSSSLGRFVVSGLLSVQKLLVTDLNFSRAENPPFGSRSARCEWGRYSQSRSGRSSVVVLRSPLASWRCQPWTTAPTREFMKHPSPETCLMWSDFTDLPACHRRLP